MLFSGWGGGGDYAGEGPLGDAYDKTWVRDGYKKVQIRRIKGEQPSVDEEEEE